MWYNIITEVMKLFENYQSPFAPQMMWGQQRPQLPQQQVTRVSGQNGAQAYALPPNSSALLLDDTAPIVWLKTTDGAGYPTLTPYDIVPHQISTPVDASSLEARIKKLEDMIYAKPDTASAEAKPAAKQPTGNGGKV
nr:MAG TPA: hypothetical protein [Caudoviricetes sp.]